MKTFFRGTNLVFKYCIIYAASKCVAGHTTFLRLYVIKEEYVITRTFFHVLRQFSGKVNYWPTTNVNDIYTRHKVQEKHYNYKD
jgi:hypothetical protein